MRSAHIAVSVRIRLAAVKESSLMGGMVDSWEVSVRKQCPQYWDRHWRKVRGRMGNHHCIQPKTNLRWFSLRDGDCDP